MEGARAKKKANGGTDHAVSYQRECSEKEGKALSEPRKMQRGLQGLRERKAEAINFYINMKRKILAPRKTS